ncbi:ATP-binding cassette domain-containing protein [Paenibacillus sp. F411]|uniref:ABC transporter ATP-binding protein n=1 Tax=Paenibacillus sp. F411 TaxID=2820239 RepID=UPI001AAE6AE5|nr:ATP-binding cassette domain-containing protein [Paenibacillus sp. F411]MBO2942627.1 ATP-binding cassette domain-containing protein [Paenibacillus sp. F411]
MTQSVIVVENLSMRFKSYKKKEGILGSITSLFSREFHNVEAIKNLSFKVEHNEIVGLLGSNGAGKTTLIKLMSGILCPSEGSIKVLGSNPFKKEHNFLKRIAVVSASKGQLFWDLSALDNFVLLREIYEIDSIKYNRILNELAQKLNVEHLLKTQIRRLSLGERMKMEIIGSLLHLPELIFLDEPTVGLDVTSMQELRSFLITHAKETKCTIIITSHNLTDIATLCNKLLLISKGRIHYSGTMSDFQEEYGNKKTLTVIFDNDMQNSIDVFNKIIDSELDYTVENDKLIVSIEGAKITNLTHVLLNQFSDRIMDIKIEEPRIEDLIQEILFEGKVSLNENVRSS